MTKKLLASFVLTIIFAMQVYAQGRTVSGKVADKKGEAIPGATIALKGNSSVSTLSKDDGTYSVENVPEKSVLTFRALGFNELSVETGTESIINVSMIEETDMEGATIVGQLGIVRQKMELGSSVTTISGDALNQGKSFGAAAALSGKVAGLQINQVSSGVNAQTRIVLRGDRSILGNNQALIVIDGSQSTQTAFNQLNPNDIESTTVLKGQSAAALYGSDASNGVLIVTTKKGVVGQTRVSFTTTQQFDRVSFLPKFQNQFGTGTGAYGRDYNGGENQSYGPAYDGTIRGLGGPGTSPMVLEDGTTNTIKYAALENEKLAVFNTGTRLQNEASVSGGAGNTKFYLSVEDVVQKGIVDKDKYRRTGVRFNAETRSNKLTAGFNIGYNSALQDETAPNTRGDSFYFNVLQTAAHIPLTQYRNWQDFKNPDGTLNPANPNNYYNEYYKNPWFELDNNRIVQRINNLTGNANAEYKVAEWMTATYRIGITNTTNFSKQITGKYTYRDYSKNVLSRSTATDINGLVNDISSYSTKITQDAYVTFDKKFSSLFKATLIVGSNINDVATQNVSIGSTSIVVDGLPNVNNRLGEAITNGGGGNIVQTGFGVTNGSTLARTSGLYADLSLGFKDFLFLHASGRNDWTSLLDKGNNSYFYPSVDLSFVVSNAIPALKNSSVLTFAKITGAASQVGQISVAPYATRSIYGLGGGFPYGGLAGFSVGNRLVKAGLKPEFTTAFEVSTEIGFFDRVNLEVAAYKTETTNQTLPATTSPTSGYTQLLTNIGKTEGLGLEVAIRGDIIKPKDKSGFNWNVNANYSYRENKVTELFAETKQIAIGTSTDFGDNNGNIFAIVGQQYPVLQVTNYLRDPQGRVVVDPITGYPSQAPSLLNVGQTNPRHTLGIGTTLSYKGFSFYALAEYRGGNVVYNDLGWDLVFTGLAQVTTNYNRERFIFPNSSTVATVDPTTGAPATYTANTSITVRDGSREFWDDHYKKYGENFVTSAAFWKLREARLSYTVPASILQDASKYIKGASISLVGRNLLMFLPKTNQFADPEFATSNGNAVGVSDNSNIPTTRTYGISINVTL